MNYNRKAQDIKRKTTDKVPKVKNYLREESLTDVSPSGNPIGICKICGKQFEQHLYEKQNRYSTYKTCPACKTLNIRKPKETLIYKAGLLSDLYPWQVKAWEDFQTHRFNVWANGVRSGKDYGANAIGIWYFIQCLNENRHIDHPEMSPPVQWWIIAPTENIAKQNWRDLKKQFPKDWIQTCRDSDMTIETIAGGIVEVRSAYNQENLVGVGLDLVTITEAARIPGLDVVWSNLEGRLNSQGRGLEKDRKGKSGGMGKAIINSTPIGKNYFYTMWKWGQKNSAEYSSDWVSYQLPWTCNPSNAEKEQELVNTKYGPMTYGEDLRRRMGDRRYRQDYLADFLATDGSVFKDFEQKCVFNVFQGGLSKEQIQQKIKEWTTPIPYHEYRIGYDPATGSSADSPTIVVRDMETNNIVLAVDMYGKNYDQQWDEIAFISRKYNYAPCAWLRTGHTAVENQLAKRGVVEIPLNEQMGKKAEYIQSLERAIQNDDLHVLLDGTETIQTLVLQMNDYTEKQGKYSNEQQEHDDFVSACYAAWYDYSQQEEIMGFFPKVGYIKRNNV